MAALTLDLFSKRLLVISGKGGVGKTVISSALGLIGSSLGKNVLLVKMDDQGRTGALFGRPALTDRIAPLRENVSGVNLDPRTIVADYFHAQLRIKRLVRHIMDSTLFKAWFRVSPAIKEMTVLGKVWSLVEESTWWRQKPVWDLVIFDAPATGHGLGLLRLPEQASKLLIGPMRTNALGVQAMLQNQQLTSLLLVTLPEEMPVNETIHFYDQARATLKMPLAGVVLNGAVPARIEGNSLEAVEALVQEAPAQAAFESMVGRGDAAADALRTAATYSRARRELTERYAAELRAKVDLPLVEVPYLFTESFGFPELEQVSESLAASLRGGS